jgi:hypothetical protein
MDVGGLRNHLCTFDHVSGGNMTQEQALIAAREIFPGNEFISVERRRSIGYKYGYPNMFYIWDHSSHTKSAIVASSTRSWEHVLAIAKSGNEDIWPEEDAPLEDEVSA